MRGHGDIHFHTWETEYVMASITVPAFDAKLLGDSQQISDTPITRIVAHGIKQFGPLVYRLIVSYLILQINREIEKSVPEPHL